MTKSRSWKSAPPKGGDPRVPCERCLEMPTAVLYDPEWTTGSRNIDHNTLWLCLRCYRDELVKEQA